jgi:hypothetical protein
VELLIMSNDHVHPVMQAALAPFMAAAPKIGALRVAPWSEYEPGQPGFVIEQFSYTSYRSDPPSWVLPAWEERGCGDLDGVFSTEEAARQALAEAA